MDNTFTSNHFQTFYNCQKQYYLKYIKKFVMPNIEDFSSVGKSVHALVNYKLNGHNIDNMLKNADDEVLKHWENLTNSDVFKYEPILTEWGFDCRIGNSEYWLNGRIDAIFYDKVNNKYIIADWKTGRNIPKNEESSFQSMIYMYAFFMARKDVCFDGLGNPSYELMNGGLASPPYKVESSWAGMPTLLPDGIKPENIEFQYVSTKSSDAIPPIVFNSEKIKIYETKFLDIIKGIKKLEKEPQVAGCNEKFCDYILLCQKV